MTFVLVDKIKIGDTYFVQQPRFGAYLEWGDPALESGGSPDYQIIPMLINGLPDLDNIHTIEIYRHEAFGEEA